MKPCSVVPGLPNTWRTPSARSCSIIARLPVILGIGSPLYRTRRESGDVVLDEERVDEHDREAAQECRGHQLAPVEGIPADQLAGDPDRHRADGGGVEEQQRIEEFVLRERESADAGGG